MWQVRVLSSRMAATMTERIFYLKCAPLARNLLGISPSGPAKHDSITNIVGNRHARLQAADTASLEFSLAFVPRSPIGRRPGDAALDVDGRVEPLVAAGGARMTPVQ